MKNIDEQIAKIQAQINQITNKKKRLISEQKQSERKKRTKRLIERGAILESVRCFISAATSSQHTSIFQKCSEKKPLTHAQEVLQKVSTAAVTPITKTPGVSF